MKTPCGWQILLMDCQLRDSWTWEESKIQKRLGVSLSRLCHFAEGNVLRFYNCTLVDPDINQTEDFQPSSFSVLIGVVTVAVKRKEKKGILKTGAPRPARLHDSEETMRLEANTIADVHWLLEAPFYEFYMC